MRRGDVVTVALTGDFGKQRPAVHWRTHQGAGLDLLVVRGGLRLGFEVKRTVAPALTRFMRSAMQDLKLKSLTVVHAGDRTFPLSHEVKAVAFRDALNVVKPLRSRARIDGIATVLTTSSHSRRADRTRSRVRG